jgi:hypothetical protein
MWPTDDGKHVTFVTLNAERLNVSAGPEILHYAVRSMDGNKEPA